MATFLDIGLLEYVKVLFPFILVWAVVYAILEWRQIFGKNTGLHSVIALVLAILTVLSDPVVQIIENMTPWFAMLLIFSVFIILFLKFFGVSDEAIKFAFEKSSDARVLVYWVVVVSIIVLAASFGSVFFSGTSVYVGGDGVSPGESVIESVDSGSSDYGVATSSGQVNFAATLFHPKVLGMLLILIIAALTIKLLAGEIVS